MITKTIKITTSDYWKLFWENVANGPADKTQIRLELAQRIFRNIMRARQREGEVTPNVL